MAEIGLELRGAQEIRVATFLQTGMDGRFSSVANGRAHAIRLPTAHP